MTPGAGPAVLPDFLPLWPHFPGQIAGAVDYVSAEGVFGWVIDVADPARPLTVQLCCAGLCLAEIATGRARPDIVSGLPEAGTPGFLLSWADIDMAAAGRCAAADPQAEIYVLIPGAGGRLQIMAETGGRLTAARALDDAKAAKLAAEAASRAAAQERSERALHALIDRLTGAPADGGPAQAQAAMAIHIDAVFACPSGTVLIAGWVDDRGNPLRRLDVLAGGSLAAPAGALGRLRRPDVDEALRSDGYSFGFWTVRRAAGPIAEGAEWVIRGAHANGCSGIAKPPFKLVSERELRAAILEYFAAMTYSGDPELARGVALGSGIGDAIIALNRTMLVKTLANPWVAQYGPELKSFAGSVIVCLFGKPEFMFLQMALFSAAPGYRDYEFIYVSNSPELSETLDKEARLCARIYGVSVTLICLADHAGLGPANNAAARFARSRRLIFAHPDVFPRDPGWARRHAGIVEDQPAARTVLFGAPLYYEDGALMHNGICFEVDAAAAPGAAALIRSDSAGRDAAPRQVPAVSGAFISAARDWFEALGGFDEDYVFSAYEDYDLCLKSFMAGRPAWLQDLPFWQMAGGGSARYRAQEGGALVNRWTFSRKWAGLIAGTLNGKTPKALSA